MARGINKAILVGNLGNDPETKYTQDGLAITKISLATTSVRKDRDGNSQENTQWHRVTFFGKLGEIAGEYLRKGSQVYVEGEIRYDKYTGQDGVEKFFTEIVANEMQMLGGRGEGGGGRGDSGGSRGRGDGGGGRQNNRQSNRQDDRQGGDYNDDRRDSRQGGGGGQRGGGGYERGGGGGRQQQRREAPQRQSADDFSDDDIPF